MAEYAYHIPRIAREARNMPRWRVAREVGVSEDTIARWETGEAIPSYDDLGRFGDAVGDPDVAHKYFLAYSDYYRKRFGDYQSNTLPMAAMKVRHSTDDLRVLQDAFERDAFDGTLDDPKLKDDYRAHLRGLISAATEMLGKIME